MRSRLELHSKLVELLGSDHVYFQPPESIRMRYPCFVYEREGVDSDLADDKRYLKSVRYEITYITKNPDTNEFIDKVLDSFRYISFTRHFISDNLNHEIFELYY